MEGKGTPPVPGGRDDRPAPSGGDVMTDPLPNYTDLHRNAEHAGLWRAERG
jgi:hypothetical protein